MNPAGSFKANAKSMLDYLYAQLHPESSHLFHAITNSQKIIKKFKHYQMAYAWIVYQLNQKKMYWHNGYTGGFLTDAYFIPQDKKALVVFNNSGQSVDCIKEIYLFNQLDCQVKNIPLEDPNKLSQYVGHYYSQELGINIQVTNTKYGFLKMQVIGQLHGVRLYNVNQHQYSFLDGKGKVIFNYSDSFGLVKSLTLIQDGNSFKAIKQ
jgi:hypothetical protein